MLKNTALLKYRCFIGLFFLLSQYLRGQEIPPVQNFTPEAYSAENQNWAIAQGANAFIYVANNSGLLEYDGARWRLYDSPNKTIIRAVESTGERIYTGAYMEFGYWQTNTDGMLEYHSLSKEANLNLIEDEQFWNIFAVDDLVLFQSLNRIYSYDTKNEIFEVFEPANSIVKAFLIEKSLFFQQEGKGLYRLRDGKPVLVSDASIFKSDVLVNLYKTQNGYVAITAQSGFFQINDSGVRDIDLPGLTSDVVIYSCERLQDGSFMLGTISSGIIHLNADYSLDYSINQRSGIANNTVLSITEDQDSNVWLGLDNGISVINSKSAYSVYRDDAGKLGSVYTAARKDNYLYLGTNQGLFYKEYSQNDSEFKLIEGTKGQVWSLNRLGDDLLCGHHLGTFLVMGTSIKPIASIDGTWQIKWLDEAKGLAIQGNYSGLHILEKQNTGWSLRNKLKGFDISSRYFGIGRDAKFYVSHEYKGVFQLDVNSQYTEVTDYSLLPQLPPAEKAGITSYNDKLFYVYKEGVFELGDPNLPIQKDTSLTRSIFNQVNYSTGKLTFDKADNKLWAFNEQELVNIQPGILSDEFEVNRYALPAQSRRDISGFENITAIGNDIYLLGNATGYILFDLRKNKDEIFRINLRSVQNSTREGNWKAVALEDDLVFEYDRSNLKMSYSVAQYDKFKSVVYQYRLKGYYDSWSPWSTQSEVSFENLSHGSYAFEVRARIGEQLSENTAQYSFKIKRPWYLSVVAIVIYILLGLVLVAAIQVLNRKHYRKQKQRLIDINNRKIELANSEKEREIIRLQNEKLQQDVESKSRELAASTMNLVKKNELLNTIKKELEQSEQKTIKPVIQIIDNNLDPKKDWEFFKEAFNNADKDFLKKIKRLHPKLTPNDLKLCAYLRLNLTSKEIAPLLNISTRSVEIKRYRLRKKMDLEREDGLVEYILSI